ncbi:MAG: hypothetical protein DIU78_015620 [Pseudomonadota bacterium]|nr:MAG: hypothetical protein DIU78_05360 [Pseudomonadota bacterium]
MTAAFSAADSTAENPPIPDLPDDATRVIGEAEARQVAEEVANLFRPIAASAYGATIEFDPDDWDGTIGRARSSVHAGRIWRITPAGTIFNPYLTRDVMRLLVCHELGHFFGGFPFKPENTPGATVADAGTFLASEGSADYFATKECAWRVWAGDPNNPAFRAVVPRAGREKCDNAWHDQARRDVCYRTLVTALDVLRWIAYPMDSDIHGPRIETPSTEVALVTKTAHPDGQCRLDTMVAGAVCDKPNDLSKIPGLVPSPVTGQYGDHSVAAEQDAAPYACHDGPGARPLCWFKANMPGYVPAACTLPEGGVCAEDGSGYWVCDPIQDRVFTPCSLGCYYDSESQIADCVT